MVHTILVRRFPRKMDPRMGNYSLAMDKIVPLEPLAKVSLGLIY
jgi:hypothetical protein